jgi:hypothetical protein
MENNELVCMRCGNVMSICQSKCKDRDSRRKLHLETINDVVSTINKILHLNKIGIQNEDDKDYNHRHLEMLKIDLSKLTSFVIHHTKDNRSQENEIKNLKSSMKSIEMIANNCLKI